MPRRLRWDWRSLWWCAPIIGVLVYVLSVRETGGAPPVPFLLLFAGVVIAGFGGAASGSLAGLLASAFVVNSTVLGFGPASLTGNFVRAAIGCVIYFITGFALGRTHDDNRRLFQELTDTRTGLEETVLRRTRDLQVSNDNLAGQILKREQAQNELEAVEGRLRHTQRLESIGLLAGGIAHDFNNLLTSILGNASLLRELSPDDAGQQKLDEVERASVRAAELCDQMLSYSGEARPVRSTFGLREVFEEMIGFVQASVPKKVTFELDCDVEVDLHADQSQIAQVILNLLTNAADSIGNNVGVVRSRVFLGKIDAAAFSEFLLSDGLQAGQYVFIEVEDNGCGMTEAQAEKVFDPFFTTKLSGRGLGLAIVFGAARAHKGAVRLRSKPGSGTSLTFVLPLAWEIDLRRDAALTDPKSDEGGIQERLGAVLVAEDDPAIRQLVAQVLEGDGWSVVVAHDGAEAIERCRERSDLVLALVDLTMPNTDGREALVQIASIDPALPVVVMSGYSKQMGQVATADHFLKKPFDADQLREVAIRFARVVPSASAPSVRHV